MAPKKASDASFRVFLVMCFAAALTQMPPAFTNPVIALYGTEVLGGSLADVAWCQSLRFIAKVAGMFWMSRLADRSGVKRALLLSMAMTALGLLVQGTSHYFACSETVYTEEPSLDMYGCVPLSMAEESAGVLQGAEMACKLDCSSVIRPVLWLGLGKVLAGLFSGVLPILKAHVTAITPDVKLMKKRQVILVATTMCTATAVSPVAGAIAIYGLHVPFLANALITALMTGVVIAVSIEHRCEKQEPSEQGPTAEASAESPREVTAVTDAPKASTEMLGDGPLRRYSVGAVSGALLSMLRRPSHSDSNRCADLERCEGVKTNDLDDCSREHTNECGRTRIADSTKPCGQSHEDSTGSARRRGSAAKTSLWMDPVLVIAMIYQTCIFAMFNTYDLLDPVLIRGLLSKTLRWDDPRREDPTYVAALVGGMNGIQGVIQGVTSTVVYLKLSNRIGDVATTRIGLVLTVGASSAFGFCTGWLQFALAKICATAGLSLVVSPIITMTQLYIRKAHSDRAAQASAIPQLGPNVGSILGPLFCAWILGPRIIAFRINLACIASALYLVLGWVLFEMMQWRVTALPEHTGHSDATANDPSAFIDEICELVRGMFTDGSPHYRRVDLENRTIQTILCRLFAEAIPRVRPRDPHDDSEHLEDVARWMSRVGTKEEKSMFVRNKPGVYLPSSPIFPVQGDLNRRTVCKKLPGSTCSKHSIASSK